MIKAYMVYPGDNPFNEGCFLIYARKRNDARLIGFRNWPSHGPDYIDFRAIRKKNYDKFYRPGNMIIEENRELPDGAPPFYTEEI